MPQVRNVALTEVILWVNSDEFRIMEPSQRNIPWLSHRTVCSYFIGLGYMHFCTTCALKDWHLCTQYLATIMFFQPTFFLPINQLKHGLMDYSVQKPRSSFYSRWPTSMAQWALHFCLCPCDWGYWILAVTDSIESYCVLRFVIIYGHYILI